MDERTRKIFDKARATLARAEESEWEHAQWLANHDPDAPDPLQAWESLRQRSEPTRQHRSSDKTYTPRPQPQQSAAMDEATQKGWDKWVTAHIKSALAEQPTFTEPQIDAMGYTISELRKEWQQHTRVQLAKTQLKLRKEFNEALASLRAELTRDTDKVLDWPRKHGA